MKKSLLVFAAFCTVALTASEVAVREIFKGVKNAYINMDGSKLLSFFHPEYTEIHPDKTVISYEGIKDEAVRLNDMGKVILRGSAENASLMEVMIAVFALNEGEMSKELVDQINAVEKTAEGKKLAVEAGKTLQDIHKLYLQKTENMWKQFQIISISIKGSEAQVVYRFPYAADGESEPVLHTVDALLIKINGRWLLKKEQYRTQQ